MGCSLRKGGLWFKGRMGSSSRKDVYCVAQGRKGCSSGRILAHERKGILTAFCLGFLTRVSGLVAWVELPNNVFIFLSRFDTVLNICLMFFDCFYDKYGSSSCYYK